MIFKIYDHMKLASLTYKLNTCVIPMAVIFRHQYYTRQLFVFFSLPESFDVMKDSLLKTPWNFGYFMKYLLLLTNYTMKNMYCKVPLASVFLHPSEIFSFSISSFTLLSTATLWSNLMLMTIATFQKMFSNFLWHYMNDNWITEKLWSGIENIF